MKNGLDEAKVRDFRKIGIMAGASTPKESIDAVIHKLEKVSNEFVEV